MGGALGLAVLAAAAVAYTASIAGSRPTLDALNSGYHAAFLTGAGGLILGALIAATLLRHVRPGGGAAQADNATDEPDAAPIRVEESS